MHSYYPNQCIHGEDVKMTLDRSPPSVIYDCEHGCVWDRGWKEKENED